MSHDYLHADPGHAGLSDTQYQHDLNQVLFDLNDTSDGGNFTSDVNHLIDEVTAVPPDLTHNSSLHDYGTTNEHLSSLDTLPQDDYSSIGTEHNVNLIPTDIHTVGYDATGHWNSWGIDSTSSIPIPTFAPDPESFGLPMSTSDPENS